ncbi:MAG: hypothetical protein ACRD3V_23900 [Vicinamibacteria bacterium]
MDNRYTQRLPGIELSIERGTERTPDASGFHVFQDDEIVGSFRKLADAQKLFVRLRDESGWKPPERSESVAAEVIARDRELSDRMAYIEYWSSSHKFRVGGRPRRSQHK